MKCAQSFSGEKCLLPAERERFRGGMRIGRRDVRLTNLDKVFFPEPGLTKGDLIAYYVDVADWSSTTCAAGRCR